MPLPIDCSATTHLSSMWGTFCVLIVLLFGHAHAQSNMIPGAQGIRVSTMSHPAGEALSDSTVIQHDGATMLDGDKEPRYSVIASHISRSNLHWLNGYRFSVKGQDVTGIHLDNMNRHIDFANMISQPVFMISHQASTRNISWSGLEHASRHSLEHVDLKACNKNCTYLNFTLVTKELLLNSQYTSLIELESGTSDVSIVTSSDAAGEFRALGSYVFVHDTERLLELFTSIATLSSESTLYFDLHDRELAAPMQTILDMHARFRDENNIECVGMKDRITSTTWSVVPKNIPMYICNVLSASFDKKLRAFGGGNSINMTIYGAPKQIKIRKVEELGVLFMLVLLPIQNKTTDPLYVRSPIVTVLLYSELTKSTSRPKIHIVELRVPLVALLKSQCVHTTSPRGSESRMKCYFVHSFAIPTTMRRMHMFIILPKGTKDVIVLDVLVVGTELAEADAFALYDELMLERRTFEALETSALDVQSLNWLTLKEDELVSDDVMQRLASDSRFQKEYELLQKSDKMYNQSTKMLRKLSFTDEEYSNVLRSHGASVSNYFNQRIGSAGRMTEEMWNALIHEAQSTLTAWKDQFRSLKALKKSVLTTMNVLGSRIKDYEQCSTNGEAVQRKIESLRALLDKGQKELVEMQSQVDLVRSAFQQDSASLGEYVEEISSMDHSIDATLEQLLHTVGQLMDRVDGIEPSPAQGVPTPPWMAALLAVLSTLDLFLLSCIVFLCVFGNRFCRGTARIQSSSLNRDPTEESDPSDPDLHGSSYMFV